LNNPKKVVSIGEGVIVQRGKATTMMGSKQQPSTNEGVILDNREDMYKQLYLALNDYHFGRIKFLELLDTWKEILHLPSSDQQPHAQQEKS